MMAEVVESDVRELIMAIAFFSNLLMVYCFCFKNVLRSYTEKEPQGYQPRLEGIPYIEKRRHERYPYADLRNGSNLKTAIPDLLPIVAVSQSVEPEPPVPGAKGVPNNSTGDKDKSVGHAPSNNRYCHDYVNIEDFSKVLEEIKVVTAKIRAKYEAEEEFGDVSSAIEDGSNSSESVYYDTRDHDIPATTNHPEVNTEMKSDHCIIDIEPDCEFQYETSV